MTFRGFSYSHQKEYVEWVGEARTEETRARRLETALAWMAGAQLAVHPEVSLGRAKAAGAGPGYSEAP